MLGILHAEGGAVAVGQGDIGDDHVGLHVADRAVAVGESGAALDAMAAAHEIADDQLDGRWFASSMTTIVTVMDEPQINFYASDERTLELK